VRLSSLFFSLIFTCALNSMAFQSENNIDYLFKLSLEELLKVKVSGSTLTPKELKTVPSSVTVFTHGEINRLGLDTLDELANLVPGFQSYRSSFSPLEYPLSSRGRRIGNAGSEILIMVDGIRLAEPRNSGNAFIAPKYPLMHIKRVEFIRGPGSAVYGSNAMMGLINIITRADVNEVTVSSGSFNRRKGHLLSSTNQGDLTLDLFAYLDIDEGDDYQAVDTFSSNRIGTDDPRDLAGLNVKLQWQNTYLNIQHNQFRVEKFYEYNNINNGFNQRAGYLSSISVKQDFDWRAISSYVWLSYTDSRLNISGQLTEPGAFTNNSTPPSSDALFASVQFDDYTETRMQWHNDWNINLQSSFQFGIEFRQIHAPETIVKNNFDLGDLASGNFPIRYYGSLLATTAVQAKSRRDIVGLYGQYQHRLFENSHLTLGLRHDDFSNIGAQLSPRFGLVQVLNDHHSLKLLYGEAFRAPSEGELNLLNNPVIFGNPDLKPETVQSSELIWVGQWPNTGISLGYFESHFKNAIGWTVSGRVRTLGNVEQGPSKGFELELAHELNDHWLLRGTYTNMIETPDLSFRESNKLASLMANYQQSNWNANLFATYHNEQDVPALDGDGNRIRLQGDWVFFAKLRYNFPSNWQAFLQVKNLLNREYFTASTTAVLTEGTPNRGREILAGIDWHF